MDKSKDFRKCVSSKAGSSKKNGNRGPKLERTEGDRDDEGERELFTLQQTYLRLGEARRAQERESQKIISRQRQLIGSLSAEKEGLLSSLSALLPTKREDHHVTRAIQAMHLRSDDIDDLMTQERDELASLEKEIRDIQRKIDKEREGSASIEDPARKIQKLTTQLAKANGRFSTLASTNSKLRQDIDTMRGEKDTFLQLHRKLQRELVATRQQKKSVLDEAIENIDMWEAHTGALRANDQREKDGSESHTCTSEAQQELRRNLRHAQMERFLLEKTKAREHDTRFLKGKEKKAFQGRQRREEQRMKVEQYEAAVEKLRDIVGHGAKKRQAGRPHGAAAQNAPSEERPRPPLWESVGRRRSTLAGPMFLMAAAAGACGGTEWERRGRRLTEHRRRSTLLPGLLAVEQERLRELARRAVEEQGRSQEEEEEEEEEEDGERPAGADAELFYNIYMEREEVNFALFNYVLEQSKMIEEMTGDLEQLKCGIKQWEETASTEGRRRSERVREMELTCQRAAEAFGRFQTDVERYERVLDLVKTGIEAMAAGSKVSTSEPFFSPKWTDDTVTQTILLLLGQTEQQTTDLLAACFYQAHMDEGRTSWKIGSVSPAVVISAPPRIQNVDVVPPPASFTADGEEEEDDEGLRPLTRDELQQRAQQMTRGTE